MAYKMNKTRWLVLALLLLTGGVWLLLGGAKPADQELDFADTQDEVIGRSGGEERPPLRIAVSTVLSATDTIRHYRTIAAHLGEQLGRPAILIQRKSYSEISLLLINGGADVAFLTSGAFATYERPLDWEGLAMQQRLGQPFYRAYLIVPKGAPYRRIEELRGKAIAFSDPQSYSGHLFVAHQLLLAGDEAERYFARTLYTYSHDKTLRAVAGRMVDAGSIDSLAYEYARRKNPELADSVRIIAESTAVGTGPVVAGTTLSTAERQTLRQSLLTMQDTPALADALQGLLIDRFVPFQSEYYDVIRRAARERRERP